MTAQPVSLEQMIALMREIRLTTVWQYQQLKIFDAAIEALRASEPVGDVTAADLNALKRGSWALRKEAAAIEIDGWTGAAQGSREAATALEALAARLSGAK